jgi:hypothetical protein
MCSVRGSAEDRSPDGRPQLSVPSCSVAEVGRRDGALSAAVRRSTRPGPERPGTRRALGG